MKRQLFYVNWLILNLFQATTTGLLDDEAYYWVYSRFPDWGYFDHPPMVALLIKAGYTIFANPLGVRLFIVLMCTATLWMIDLLIGKRNDKLFFTIALSMFLLQIGGILAVPDLPLIFFVALFFVVYKQFIKRQNFLYGLLLGIVSALMCYSKYHGLLVIFFTLLSNPRLFLKWTTWLAAVTAGLLLLPHLMWQINHGNPSLNYHLFERNALQYQAEFTIEYIYGQILLAGPLIGWMLWWGVFKYKPEDEIEKALKWNVIGITLLFLAASFKGRTEANWTVPVFVGLIVLGHRYINTNQKLEKWVYRLMIPAVVLILVLRIYMMSDIKPLSWFPKDEFHKTREWANAIHDSAKGLPVVFVNSYQKASQYWFYTGDTSFSLNTLQYRRNNYNFWPLEERLQGKKVMVVKSDRSEIFPNAIANERKMVHYFLANPYFSFTSLQLSNDKTQEISADKKTWKTTLELKTISQTKINSFAPGSDTAHIYVALFAHDDDVAYLLRTETTVNQLIKQNRVPLTIDISSLKKQSYRYKWGIGSSVPGMPSMNSVSYKLGL
jgi:hypothetical protein